MFKLSDLANLANAGVPLTAELKPFALLYAYAPALALFVAADARKGDPLAQELCDKAGVDWKGK